MVVVCSVAAIYVTNASLSQPPFAADTKRYVLENIGVGLIAMALTFAISLKQVQKSVYRLFWLKLNKTQPDERQEQVRQSVFEKSYGLLLIIAWLLLSNTDASGHMRLVSMYTLGVLAISLPSIIAAWHKES